MNFVTSRLLPITLLLLSTTTIVTSKECLDIIHNECLSLDAFVGHKQCRMTSSFGPWLSKCRYYGKLMFNEAVTYHGRRQEQIRSICPGTIERKGMYLHDHQIFTTVTQHDFTEKCTYEGKEYETFEIYYGHSDGKDPKWIRTGTNLSAGDVFANIGSNIQCGGGKGNFSHEKPVLVLLVKIGHKFVNPMVLFPKATGSGTQMTGVFHNQRKGFFFNLEAPCETMTASRYEIKCGSKVHVFDANTKEGYPSNRKGPLPNHSMHFEEHPIIWSVNVDPPKWKSSVIVPRKWFGSNQCCTAEIKDVYGDTMWKKSHCWKGRGQ